MERRERQVLELPLDRVDAEPVRQRREDLERLLGLLLLLLLRHRLDRAHVVQAIGELDQDDPDVLGHRDHHLAVVLGLAVVAALEGDPGELRDAVDERGDLVAELLAHLVERGARVLDGVVQQGGAERGGVEAHARADLGHADRVDDEVLAAGAPLVGVALAGEHERLLDEPAVDLLDRLVGVLLDHGEEVAEEDALLVGELGGGPGGRRRGLATTAPTGLVLEAGGVLDRRATAAAGLAGLALWRRRPAGLAPAGRLRPWPFDFAGAVRLRRSAPFLRHLRHGPEFSAEPDELRPLPRPVQGVRRGRTPPRAAAPRTRE